VGLAVLIASSLPGCAGPPRPVRAREPAPSLQGGRIDTQPAASPRIVRVAGILLKWITADKQRNYDRAVPLIRQAARRGAQVVITTECFLDGYAIRDQHIPLETWRALGEAIPGGPYLTRLQQLAHELDIYLVAGLLERAGDNTYNAAVLLGPDGELIGKYRKQHLGHEQPRNTPGDTSPVFSTRLGRIGLMICADRLHPQTIRRLGDSGAELIICPSGGMWGPIHNDYHLQARSRENRVPIVFVHPLEFLVTGPDGSILARRFVAGDMSIPAQQIGTEPDRHLVALYDLPLEPRPGR